MVHSAKHPVEKPTEKTKPNFLEKVIFLVTGATICTLNTQTCSVMKAYISTSKKEITEDVDTKLRTANNQLLPIGGIFKLILLPFKDHHAAVQITVAIAGT